MPISGNDFPQLSWNDPGGDPDPISAGTVGEAVLWGGASAAVGMAANLSGAH